MPAVGADRRVLYEIAVHAELNTGAEQPEGPAVAYAQVPWIFSWGPLRRAGSCLGYFAIPPAVQRHFDNRPPYSVSSSSSGEHVAVLTQAGIFLRSRRSRFEGNDQVATWNIPAGADRCLGRWHMAWAADASRLAVATSAGVVYVLDQHGSCVASCVAPTELAGIVVCSAGEHAGVICVTHSGGLHWLSLEGEATAPAASASVISGRGMRGVCVGAICFDAQRNILFVGCCTRGLPGGK